MNASTTTPSTSVKMVEPGTLFDEMIHGRSPFIIDVRSSREIEHSKMRFPHAKNIPSHDLLVRRIELPRDPTMPIVTVSADGGRARAAALALAFLGYRNVRFLAGGIERWAHQRFPTLP